MRTYHYVLFLKHPETHDCINHHIELDSDGEYMDARELFANFTVRPRNSSLAKATR